MTPEFEVLKSAAGYYIGTMCICGPYSRESGYYPTEAAAAADLELAPAVVGAARPPFWARS